MVKKLLLLSSFALSAAAFVTVEAQQDAYYSHYMFTRLNYNPAAAGYKDAICANLLGHNQWLGYNDEAGPPLAGQATTNTVNKGVGPKTFSANISGRLNMLNLKNTCVGFTAIQDAVGYQNNLNFKLALAQRIPLKRADRTIAVGLDAGFLQKSIDGSKLNPKTLGDPSIPTAEISSKQVFDLGAGLYYSDLAPFLSMPDMHDLYAGISATHLTQPTVTYSNSTHTIQAQEVMHLYAVAGVDWDLPIAMPLMLSPSILVKRNALTQLDVSVMATYNSQFRAGLAFRTLPKNSDALSILLGFIPVLNTKNNGSMYIGYSYDLTVSDLKRSSNGTHEIFLNYCFKLPSKQPPEYMKRNTRHL